MQHLACELCRDIVFTSEVGGESNREIASPSAVRTCMRAVWLPSGTGSQKRLPPFTLFPFWPAELSLLPFGGDELPFSLPSTPQTSYPPLLGLIGV